MSESKPESKPKRRPNFVVLDTQRPDVAAIIHALVELGGMLEGRPWDTPYEPATEAWWQDALYDPRARWPNAVSFSETSQWVRLRLDRHPYDRVLVVCSFCRRSHEIAKAALIESFGPDASIVKLQSRLMPNCAFRRQDGCAAVVAWTRARGSKSR